MVNNNNFTKELYLLRHNAEEFCQKLSGLTNGAIKCLPAPDQSLCTPSLSRKRRLPCGESVSGTSRKKSKDGKDDLDHVQEEICLNQIGTLLSCCNECPITFVLCII